MQSLYPVIEQNDLGFTKARINPWKYWPEVVDYFEEETNTDGPNILSLPMEILIDIMMVISFIFIETMMLTKKSIWTKETYTRYQYSTRPSIPSANM
jgi:hypothetical protein